MPRRSGPKGDNRDVQPEFVLAHLYYPECQNDQIEVFLDLDDVESELLKARECGLYLIF